MGHTVHLLFFLEDVCVPSGYGGGKRKITVLGRVWRTLRFFCRQRTLTAQGLAGFMHATQATLHFQGIFANKTQMWWRGNEGGAQGKWFVFSQKKKRTQIIFSALFPAEMIAFCGWSASKMMWGLSLASEACHFGAFSPLRRLGLRSPKPLWAKCGATRPQSHQRVKTLPKRWLANRKFSLPFPFHYPHPTKQLKKKKARAVERSIPWIKGDLYMSLSRKR